MNLSFANGTARQQSWVNEAVARCHYPFNLLTVSVLVRFTTLTNCSVPHVYMCTSGGSGAYTIQVETWADDPTNPNNQGLADPAGQLHEFFVDSFIHELGHVVQDELITGAKVGQLCAYFVHIPDGRRGTAADYLGTESSQTRWADFITEATSEYFRLAYLPEPQIYWNRSNWFLSEADYLGAFALLTPGGFRYGPPVDCSVGVTELDSGSVTIGTDDIPLQRLSAFYPSASNPANVPIEPDWVWDFDISAAGDSSEAQQIFTPGAWGLPGSGLGDLIRLDGAGGREEFPDGSLGGDLPVLDVTLDGGVTGPFGIDILHDIHQPWTNFPYGPALGGDLDARSAWLTTRAVKYAWTLPHGHDWGVVELGISGQTVEPDTPHPAFSGVQWNSYDVDGNPLRTADIGGDTPNAPPQSTGPPPWLATFPPQTIAGNGPFFDHPAPQTLEKGWLSALVLTHTIEWRSRAVTGHSVAYLGTSEESVILPSPDIVPPPSAPPEAGSTSGTSGDHPTIDAADWNSTPIMSPGVGLSYPAAAHRDHESFTRLWTGPNVDADILTRAAIRVRFFPVVSAAGGPPPPYPKQPNTPSSMTVGAGLRGQVRIPAVSGLLGLQQKPTASPNAPGAQTSRSRGSSAGPGLRGQHQLLS